MPLEEFQEVVSDNAVSVVYQEAAKNRKEDIDDQLESIIKDCFRNLNADSSKSFHFNDGKVIVDREELVEQVMLMCAVTVKEVCD